MAAEPHVCDGIDLKWMYASDSEDDEDWNSNSPVVLTQELSLKGKIRRLLFRNAKTRLGSTLFDIIVKLILCVLYIIRIQFDNVETYACGGNPCGENSTYQVYPDNDDDGMIFSSAEINWQVLLWVHRPEAIWIIEVILAIFTFSKALLFIFISKLGKVELMTKPAFILEVICSLPLIITLTYPMLLKNLYVPTFLNCWLAKRAMERLFNDLHLTKQRFQTISVTMSQQLLILGATLVSLIFTTVCGIQHIQRASSEKSLTLFESFYFTIVTFSTVGYGDISPDIWLGQLFMVLMICIAFAFIPRQIEGIGSIWVERKKSGGEYNSRQARKNHHVVVCAQNLAGDAIMDFLTEFYSCPKHEEYTVILLSTDELNSSMHMILKDPKWANRVIYMRGSALKAADLNRCRMNEADACFILAPENCTNKDQEDHNTIMRSWAVKDFCPETNQFIQLFRTENKIHVKFAEHVVCEDEFAYALLANNCLYPGLSTLVSLLVHTSTGFEGELASEPWMQLYGRHSGNEVYHIQLGKSIFFSQYEGKTFSAASAEVHSKYGVSLIAIMETDFDKVKDQELDHKLVLNPGPNYILKSSDFCFYLSKVKEEHTRITPQENSSKDEEQAKKKQQKREKNYEKIATELQRFLENNHLELESTPAGEESVFNTITSQMGLEFSSTLRDTFQSPRETPDLLNGGMGESKGDTTEHHNVLLMYNEMASEETTPQYLCVNTAKRDTQSRFVTGTPPIFLTGCRKTLCHLVKNPRHQCCLKWGEDCSHVNYKNARDDRWQNHLIILSADKICVGVYNFIVPLRSKFLSIKSLSPIILMLEEEPPSMFVDSLAHFPMVYWMKGNIKNVDDLLRAGINKASHLVIVNRSSSQARETVLTDADTVVTVQSIFKLFPGINILTEISQTSNIKFMQFQPHDEYSKKIAKIEKKLRDDLRSSLVHIFRLPFAAGQVFSCSMLDTLLYQTCSKGYLIKFVRLLLGIDAEENSGHLSSIKVKRDILKKYKTYGDLYIGLCKVTGEVPIAIYRTEKRRIFLEEEEHHPLGKKNVEAPHRNTKSSFSIKQFFERAIPNDLSDFVRSRMTSMSIDPSGYSCDEELCNKPLSFIIINPHPQCKLKKGDIVYVLQPSAMFAIPSRMQHKHHWKRRRSWSEGINNRTQQETPARSRTHSIDIPARNVTFNVPSSDEGEVSPKLDKGVEINLDAEPLDELDTVLPKASTAKAPRGNPPIFSFTFPDSDNEGQVSVLDPTTSNASNNNDIPLKETPPGKPEDPAVAATKETPTIVITRTPTKTFLTERVPEA